MTPSPTNATNPPMTSTTYTAPEELHSRLEQATQRGLETKALVPLSTTYLWVEDQSTNFVVRQLQNVQKKEATKAIQVANKEVPRPSFNPFLPYESNLFVGDICDSHAVVLNKFNVVDHHALLITREFQSQWDYLTQDDWNAVTLCLEGVDGLVFFNGGEEAGASQPHKHLQLVLLPMTPEPSQPSLPITPLMQQLPSSPTLNPVEAFPFAHAACCMRSTWTLPQEGRAQRWFATYKRLLTLASLWTPTAQQLEPKGQQQAPYNMLATHDWILLVPRRCEFYESISVNSLGFAGGLLVKHQEALDTLRAVGPWRVLQHVGVPRTGS